MANEKLMTRETAKEVVSGYTQKLENGQIIPSKSLVAKELETVSPESGDTQETPFALQGTGTANGTSSVDTGTVGKHIQKQGNVYCVNQLFNSTATSRTTGGLTLTTYANGRITISGTAENTDFYNIYTVPLQNGRKILFKTTLTQTGSSRPYVSFENGNIGLEIKWNGIGTTTGSNNGYLRVFVNAGDVVNFDFYANVIDLTKWFNGNIPQDLLDHPEHWSWYQTYGDYIAYNIGTLVSGNGQLLVCGGRNIWDEEWELGGINGTTGVNYPSTTEIRSKNYIPVIPATTYYFKHSHTGRLFYYDKNKNYISSQYTGSSNNYTIPINCCFIRFIEDTTTYNHDICISLYYAGEDYSQYYKYEQPKVYDTGSEELLSTGVKLNVSGEREDIYDYKEPSGLITRRVGEVKLKDLSWEYVSATGTMNAYVVPSGSYPLGHASDINTPFNAINNVYINIDWEHAKTGYDNTNKTSGLYSNGSYLYLRIRDDSYTNATTFKNHFADNDYLYYELATPTTEQGTPFSENIEINDFGTMGWYATYTDANTNALVSVPQGCKIFYPAWYVGFIDTLGQRDDIDWNASNVVSQSELQASETQRNTIDTQLKEALGGTLRQLLASVNSLDFNDTAWVDLGSLNWIYDSTYTVFTAPISNLISGTTLKFICTKYKSSTVHNSSSPDKTIFTRGTGADTGVGIKDSAYTDATTFKNAMKGVLLAYEKAS